jgi:peptidoglycan glycosyltransferase
MFLTVVIYLGKFILIDGPNTVNSMYNPRLNRVYDNIKRGSILDRNGNILAESLPVTNDNGEAVYARAYPYGSLFAHTVGFIHETKSGAEAKYNFVLNNLDLEIWQRIKNIAVKEPLVGDSIKLTLDMNLQELIKKELGQTKGAAVVMEPDTGKVLAMVSYPDFDPNSIADDWEWLSEDTEGSPLINRASQGLYPPGSVFKVVTADAIINNKPDYASYYYECTGEAVFGDSVIHCFDSKSHGSVNLSDAIKYSCNTYFATVINEIGYDKLAASAQKVLFNADYNFDLEHVLSRFNAPETEDKLTTSEIIQTAIGQGKTLVTPVHMAMITSAIANNGVMMEPFVCEQVLSPQGRVKSVISPKVAATVFSPAVSNIIKDMMVSVVDGGTGTNAAVYGIKVAGKTGTAQNETSEDHGWFIAFAPADDPKIAIAIVTENTEGASKATTMAGKIFESYLK